MNNRVLILTEGGKEAGFGHITRCQSLAQVLLSKNHSVSFVVSGDNSIKNLVDEKSFLLFDWFIEQKKILDLLKNFDFVIIDSYLADKKFYDLLSEKTKKRLLMIDDYQRITYPEGLLVNPSLIDDSVKYPLTKNQTSLTGEKYIILRNDFIEASRFSVKKELKNILVTLGGSEVLPIINTIKELLEKKFTLEIIEPHKNPLSASQMTQKMLACDVCISAGGQTLYELVCLNVPTIAVCVADNQIHNIKTLAQKKVLLSAGKYHSPDFEKKLLDSLEKLKSYVYRNELVAQMKGSIDGLGASRIISAFIEKKTISFTLRLAEKKDSEDILRWRNHPEVRKWSFEAGKIGLKEHNKWVTAKINHKDTCWFIAENNKHQKIGQVRFDIQKKSSIINVNLNPEFFGKHLGPILIEETTKKFFQKHQEINEVVAEMFVENAVSEKAFLKAGYSFLNKSVKNDRKIQRLIFRK